MDNDKTRQVSGTLGKPSRMDIAFLNGFESWNTSEGHTTELIDKSTVRSISKRTMPIPDKLRALAGLHFFVVF